MAMGILGQIVYKSTDPELVYTVPVGKVAAINIFVTSDVGEYGRVLVNNANCGTSYPHAQLKGIIANAGTTVKFQNCTGIVTGYEEDV